MLTVGMKVLYEGEVYYVRELRDDGYIGLSRNIDGPLTLIVVVAGVRPLHSN